MCEKWKIKVGVDYVKACKKDGDLSGSAPIHGSADDNPRCACGCFLTVEGAWVGESHYDDFAKVYCSNPRCKLKKQNATGELPPENGE